MPHDKNGTELKVGDVVTIDAKIKDISASAEYCNLTLATIEPLFPTSESTSIVLNAKQVVLNPVTTAFSLEIVTSTVNHILNLLEEKGDLAISTVRTLLELVAAFTRRDLASIFLLLNQTRINVTALIEAIKIEFKIGL